MKLYLDENISPNVASELNEKGIDALSVYDVKNRGLSDREQFEFAQKEKRTFTTYDIVDFLEIGKEYISKGKEHYGIILVSSKTIPQGNIGKLVLSIQKLLTEANKEKDFFKNKIIYLTS